MLTTPQHTVEVHSCSNIWMLRLDSIIKKGVSCYRLLWRPWEHGGANPPTRCSSSFVCGGLEVQCWRIVTATHQPSTLYKHDLCQWSCRLIIFSCRPCQTHTTRPKQAGWFPSSTALQVISGGGRGGAGEGVCGWDAKVSLEWVSMQLGLYL